MDSITPWASFSPKVPVKLTTNVSSVSPKTPAPYASAMPTTNSLPSPSIDPSVEFAKKFVTSVSEDLVLDAICFPIFSSWKLELSL
eukprot:7514622-Pyramimonas_sp.AAC.1